MCRIILQRLGITSLSRRFLTMATTSDDQTDKIQEKKDKYLKMELSEKRSLYRCEDRYTTLKDIQTWTEKFSQTPIRKTKQKPKKEIVPDFNDKVSIFTGDITTLEIDAIANAANESLLGGGGVDGAIHRAAGPALVKECRTLGGCEAGDAKISGGYKLPAKYVIHTVGPRGRHPEKLESCYKTCLNLLKQNNLRSIAFPCISTGIFGYPNVDAANVALETVRSWLESEQDDHTKKVDRIIFCLFLQKDIDIYQEEMQVYFPMERLGKADNTTVAEEKCANTNNASTCENSEQSMDTTTDTTDIDTTASAPAPTLKKEDSVNTRVSALNMEDEPQDATQETEDSVTEPAQETKETEDIDEENKDK